MNSKRHCRKRVLALIFALSLTSCGVAMTEGQRWLDSKKDAPEMNVSGRWFSSEWGDTNFNQEQKDVTGQLGDYPVRGVVSGNSLYLLMYSGSNVHYSAKLTASDENTFEGSYSKYSIIDEPRSGNAYVRPIHLRRVHTPSGGVEAVRSQPVQSEKGTPESVAAVPKEVTEPKFKRITLRSTPDQNYYENELYNSIKAHNFYSKSRNPSGDFPNHLVDNGNGTVTDRVTGLMWQKEGNSFEVSFSAASEYVKELNASRFAGYTNWRLPTTEELCSLLEPGENKRGQHIDMVFAGNIFACWSSDEKPYWAYVAYFGKGDVEPSHSQGAGEQRNFVRAVRTID